MNHKLNDEKLSAAEASKWNIQNGNDVYFERLQCRGFRNVMTKVRRRFLLSMTS